LPPPGPQADSIVTAAAMQIGFIFLSPEAGRA
jgi:hypothetical protein